MTCDEFRAWVNNANEMGTLAERSAAREHTNQCKECCNWGRDKVVGYFNDRPDRFVAVSLASILQRVIDMSSSDPEV